MFPIQSRLRAALLLSIAMAAMFAAAPAAQAWYVDLSITGAGNVWEYTDADELDEHCTAFPEEGFSSPSTTPTDTLGATCRAGDASGDYGNGWIVEYRAVPASGYRFERWRARAGESETSIKCDGSDNSPEYTETNCRFQIWENLHTQARFVDDTPPTMSSLNGPSGQINGSAEFTFSAAADPTFARFECRLVKLVTAGESQLHAWQTCSSGHDEDPAAAGTEGSYKLYVRAVDRSNNTSGDTTNSWSWSVDKIRPDTTLDSGSGPTGTTTGTSATFAFSGSADVASYRCSLDDVEAACESPVTYTGLEDGEHTFEVWSRDDAGNDDLSPASRTWVVDTTPPNTSLSGGPAEGSATASTSASFSFTGTEAGTFECQLDGTGFAACESPRTVTGLTSGEHTFEVRARDGAGNVDASPASRTWVVDATPPDTTLSGGPVQGSSTTSTSASFSFSSSEAGTFECRLDGTGFAACESPRDVTGLAPGQHTFAVRARDAAGNLDATPASRQWTVTAAPAPGTGTGSGAGAGTGGGPGPGTSGQASGPGPGTSGQAGVIGARVRTFWKLFGKRTQVAKLTVTGAPVGSKVTITCKGKGKAKRCKFRRLRLTVRGSKLALAKRFKRKKLAAGTVITITIAKQGMIAKTFRYRTRARKFPTSHVT